MVESRMHDTRRDSTSAASTLSSFEMNSMLMRVYGFISLMRTCGEIFTVIEV